MSKQIEQIKQDIEAFERAKINLEEEINATIHFTNKDNSLIEKRNAYLGIGFRYKQIDCLIRLIKESKGKIRQLEDNKQLKTHNYESEPTDEKSETIKRLKRQIEKHSFSYSEFVEKIDKLDYGNYQITIEIKSGHSWDKNRTSRITLKTSLDFYNSEVRETIKMIGLFEYLIRHTPLLKQITELITN